VNHSSVKRCHRESKVRAAPIIFLCALSWMIGAYAQSDSSPLLLNEFQIQPLPPAQYILLAGAALSPDGQHVAAAYFDGTSRSRPLDVVLSVRIWNVGTQKPVGSVQLGISQENPYDTLSHGFFGGSGYHPDGFVQYCNNGSGIMVADPHGTLYYLNPQTPEVLHATATNIGLDVLSVFDSERVYCAASSPRAVFAVYGGRFGNGRYGNGLVRVYDLTSGTLLQEWDMTKGPFPFGDVAISPSGNEIAVSHVPTNFTGVAAKAVENLELFDVNTGKSTLQVKTGHLPGRVSFVGEGRVATGDTTVTQPFYRLPRIKLWDTSNGKFIREFGDPQVGARRFVGASSDGNVILGYIPKERAQSAAFTGAWNDTLQQRFRLWEAGTGQTIATSPPFLPILRIGPRGLDPSLELSANGRAVLVFWKSPGLTQPIYVFSNRANDSAPIASN
jgi:WD40 repeat protein